MNVTRTLGSGLISLFMALTVAFGAWTFANWHNGPLSFPVIVAVAIIAAAGVPLATLFPRRGWCIWPRRCLLALFALFAFAFGSVVFIWMILPLVLAVAVIGSSYP